MPTTNLSLTLPTVGGSSDSWGTELNTALTAIDTWAGGAGNPLLKTGGTMTGALVGAVGSVSAPGFSFAGDLDCGFYRIGANNIGLALNGVKQVDYTTTGVAFTGTLTATAASFTTGTFTGLVLTPASASGGAGFRLAPGSAPSSPTNGDVWITSSGMYARVGGTTKQLDAAATGVWSTPRNLSLTSDVTATLSSVDGSANVSAAATIANSAVTLAKMANLAQARVIGRASGAGTGVPTALTEAQLSALVDLSAATMGTGSGFSGEFKIGPLYLKCGNASVTPAQSGTTGEATVTFSHAFPTGFLAGGHCPDLTGGALGSGNNYAAYIRGPTTAAMAIGLDQDGAGSPGAITCYWWAIGY